MYVQGHDDFEFFPAVRGTVECICMLVVVVCFFSNLLKKKTKCITIATKSAIVAC